MVGPSPTLRPESSKLELSSAQNPLVKINDIVLQYPQSREMFFIFAPSQAEYIYLSQSGVEGNQSCFVMRVLHKYYYLMTCGLISSSL
jgi:hypothetical protein